MASHLIDPTSGASFYWLDFTKNGHLFIMFLDPPLLDIACTKVEFSFVIRHSVCVDLYIRDAMQVCRYCDFH